MLGQAQHERFSHALTIIRVYHIHLRHLRSIVFDE